jgi:hypothetical protein
MWMPGTSASEATPFSERLWPDITALASLPNRVSAKRSGSQQTTTLSVHSP